MLDKDAFYFPHFSNARKDRKLLRVRKELELDGYAIYFMILEVLREEKDFRYPLEDIDLLADEFGTTEPKIRAVVCNYKLFESDGTYFWSDKLIEFLKPYLDLKQKKKIAGIKGNLLKYEKISKTKLLKMTDQQVLDFNEDIKRSQCDTIPIAIKRNKIKRKEIKENNIYINIFDCWNNQKIIIHQKFSTSMKSKIDTRLKDFTTEEIIKSIENYSAIYHSDKTWFSYKWTLEEFLKRDNGMKVFLYKNVDDYLNSEYKNNSTKQKNEYTPEQIEEIINRPIEEDLPF